MQSTYPGRPPTAWFFTDAFWEQAGSYQLRKVSKPRELIKSQLCDSCLPADSEQGGHK